MSDIVDADYTDLGTRDHPDFHPPAPSGVVLPVAEPAEMQRAMVLYQKTKTAVLDPSDWQDAGRGQRFVKKSGWAKLAIAFGVSVEIKDGYPKMFYESGALVRAEFVVRAVAPNGRFAEGWGSCSASESRFKGNAQKIEHDLPATAETRARNRAYAALFGHGEVSYEEAVLLGETDTAPVMLQSTNSARQTFTQRAETPPQSGQASRGNPASQKQIDYIRTIAEGMWLAVETEGMSSVEASAILDGLRGEGPGKGKEFRHPRLKPAATQTPNVNERQALRDRFRTLAITLGYHDDYPEHFPADELPERVRLYEEELAARREATGGEMASAKQLETIGKLKRLLNIKDTSPGDLTKAQASDRITDLSRRYNESKGVRSSA
jgi:hypothetical protein